MSQHRTRNRRQKFLTDANLERFTTQCYHRHPNVPTHQFGIKKFDVGDAIYVRDYRAGHKPRNKGSIAAQRGRVMYDVNVGNDLWTRHYNQLRPQNSNIPTSTQSSLPLDILLDTFNLPTADKTEKQKCAAQTTPDKAEAANKQTKQQTSTTN
uniref:Uncharacterized protein n=1 Tax=Trichobilharzia regenti TaxID=157069 RepID=A0AA85K5R6_TRIRE|nr:unnamed protein product [Trichobilharzia regenti]